jgi:hypothetical protein
MFAAYSLAEQVTSARGAKTCQLTKAGKKVQTLCSSPAPHGRPQERQASPVVVPFPPSTYDKDANATRLTLELRCNAEMLTFFDAFDEWAKTYLLEHSMRLFKKQLTAAQILEGYHPTVRRHPQGMYEPLLRCKIDTCGRREVSYWTPECVRREAPQDWRRVTVVPHLEIVSLWNMSRDLGWVIQCTALRVFEDSPECPFAVDEDEMESMDQ